jgi:hypothetical protein
MKQHISFLFLVLVVALNAKAATINKPISSQYSFIQNKGQIIDQNNQLNPHVLYLYNGNGLRVQLRKGGFSYEVIHAIKTPKTIINEEPTGKFASEADSFDISHEVHRVDINFKNGNKNVVLRPYEPASDYINYYTTATPEQGITQVQHFQKVIYENVYPNIDIEFVLNDATNKGQFKYNFIVKPHANLADIQLELIGANHTSLNKAGNILIETAYGNIEENIPLSYEINEDNSHSSIEANFIAIANNIFGIKAEDYNHSQTLVIDPSNWATYYGGSNGDSGYGIATDASGNIIITGETYSSNAIATVGAHQIVQGVNSDAFTSKFNTNGVIQWATYYGGSGADYGRGIAIDASANIIITGNTNSSNAITTSGAHQATFDSISDAFIAKFNTNGMRQWATYYGGSSSDYGSGITTDANGNIIIIGYTESSNAIATIGAHQTVFGGNTDGFIAKFNTNGVRQWATYYGGSGNDYGMGIATDASGNIVVTGFTNSSTAITTGGVHQTVFGGFNDAVIAKFNNNGIRQWATYYGGIGDDRGFGITTDVSGNIVVTGLTNSANAIATVGAHQIVYGDGQDAYIAKFNNNGIRQWATYFGGSNDDIGRGIAIVTDGNIIITGQTSSSNAITTVGAHQTIFGGGHTDAFIVKFNTNGIRQWGTYYGGANTDYPLGIVIDANGNIIITGSTFSPNAIATVGAHQTTFGGGTLLGGDAFIAKFSAVGVLSVKLIEFNDEKVGSKISLYYENNNPIVKVNAEVASNAIIELMSLAGIPLFTQEQATAVGENAIAINSNGTSGFYLLKVQLEDHVAYFKVWMR